MVSEPRGESQPKALEAWPKVIKEEPEKIEPLTARFGTALYDNAEEFGVQLNKAIPGRLRSYYALLLRWNPHLHLVGPCSPKEFARRHVLESLMLLPHLLANARVIDVGSGAGLPIIPCLIARADLRATLIESSPKKAVFLNEALKIVDAPERATVIAERFENLATPAAEYLTCRALDRFADMLPKLIGWAPPRATLLIFAGEDLRKQIEGYAASCSAFLLPGSKRRFLVRVEKSQ